MPKVDLQEAADAIDEAVAEAIDEVSLRLEALTLAVQLVNGQKYGGCNDPVSIAERFMAFVTDETQH